MTKYTKYNADTGEIEYVFEGKAEDADANQPCIEGAYYCREYTIVNGEPVRRSDAEIEAAELVIAQEKFIIIRNGLLADSDWTQSPDSPLSETQQQSWRDYRQALRDLPASTSDPRNPTWPTKPT